MGDAIYIGKEELRVWGYPTKSLQRLSRRMQTRHSSLIFLHKLEYKCNWMLLAWALIYLLFTQSNTQQSCYITSLHSFPAGYGKASVRVIDRIFMFLVAREWCFQLDCYLTIFPTGTVFFCKFVLFVKKVQRSIKRFYQRSDCIARNSLKQFPFTPRVKPWVI